MKISFLSGLFYCLLLLIASTAAAETRYISDQIIVTVRSNMGKQYDTLETLLTASPVEIIEETGGYVKVRTKKGTEGYIRKQYVTTKTPKSTQIAQLKRQKATLQTKIDKLNLDYQKQSETANTHQANTEALTNDLKAAQQNLNKVKSAYENFQERAKNVVALANERDRLLEENNSFSDQLTVLQAENKEFHRSNMIQWFLAGGGVFFGGWLIGKISRKKRGFNR